MIKKWFTIFDGLPEWIDTLATTVAIVIFVIFIKPVFKYIVDNWKGDRNRVAKMESDIGKVFSMITELNANIIVYNKDNKAQMESFRVMIEERSKTNHEIKNFIYITLETFEHKIDEYSATLKETTARLNNVSDVVAGLHGEHLVHHGKNKK